MFDKLRANIEKQDMSVAGFSFRVDPTIKLNNVSGTGVFTKLFSEDKVYNEEAKSEFVDRLLECNFDIPLHQNPGFYFSFEGETYSVRSSKFLSTSKNSKKKTTSLPLPISGFIK